MTGRRNLSRDTRQELISDGDSGCYFTLRRAPGSWFDFCSAARVAVGGGGVNAVGKYIPYTTTPCTQVSERVCLDVGA